MPAPSFFGSPRPDQPSPDASPTLQSSSRFSTFHNNVRSMINGSSIYSASPTVSGTTWPSSAPKSPFLGFFRRPQHPPSPIIIPENYASRESSDSRSPLNPPHTARSYMRTIAGLASPQHPQAVAVHDRHPADVPLDYEGPGWIESIDPETEQIQSEPHGRRRRRRRRTHRRKHRTHWVRRKDERRMCFGLVKGQAARKKCIGCLISGLFLIIVLAIYLALALIRKNLGQEIHIVFILIILATTIFFCHSLIRLFMLAMHPPRESASSVPNMIGSDGFNPIRPIRVHVQRDEELEDEEEAIEGHGDIDELKEKPVAIPPPAYGLWRSSVRVDPNLLHWQRVEAAQAAENRASVLASPIGSRNGSVPGPPDRTDMSNVSEPQGPRPPSYVSEDGVSYIVEAAPRSVAPSHTGVSEIHPAWRPGFAMSEIRPNEWPAPLRI